MMPMRAAELKEPEEHSSDARISKNKMTLGYNMNKFGLKSLLSKILTCNLNVCLSGLVDVVLMNSTCQVVSV